MYSLYTEERAKRALKEAKERELEKKLQDSTKSHEESLSVKENVLRTLTAKYDIDEETIQKTIDSVIKTANYLEDNSYLIMISKNGKTEVMHTSIPRDMINYVIDELVEEYKRIKENFPNKSFKVNDEEILLSKRVKILTFFLSYTNIDDLNEIIKDILNIVDESDRNLKFIHISKGYFDAISKYLDNGETVLVSDLDLSKSNKEYKKSNETVRNLKNKKGYNSLKSIPNGGALLPDLKESVRKLDRVNRPSYVSIVGVRESTAKVKTLIDYLHNLDFNSLNNEEFKKIKSLLDNIVVATDNIRDILDIR